MINNILFEQHVHDIKLQIELMKKAERLRDITGEEAVLIQCFRNALQRAVKEYGVSRIPRTDLYDLDPDERDLHLQKEMEFTEHQDLSEEWHHAQQEISNRGDE